MSVHTIYRIDYCFQEDNNSAVYLFIFIQRPFGNRRNDPLILDNWQKKKKVSCTYSVKLLTVGETN